MASSLSKREQRAELEAWVQRFVTDTAWQDHVEKQWKAGNIPATFMQKLVEYGLGKPEDGQMASVAHMTDEGLDAEFAKMMRDVAPPPPMLADLLAQASLEELRDTQAWIVKRLQPATGGNDEPSSGSVH